MNYPGSRYSLYCDISTTPRPFITKHFRKPVFLSLHSLSHPGATATAKLVVDRFVWPGMRRDCREWARTCLSCRRAKVSRHVSAPLCTFNLPRARFKFAHIDLIGHYFARIQVLPHGYRPNYPVAKSSRYLTSLLKL